MGPKGGDSPYPVGMGPKGGDSGGIITTFVPTLWAWDQRAFDCKSKGDNGWKQEGRKVHQSSPFGIPVGKG